MLLKTIEKLKYLISEYRFYFLIIAVLLAFLIYSYNETLALQKQLIQIDKQLYQQQVTFERRQKAHDEKEKRQRAELERMIKEIKSHK